MVNTTSDAKLQGAIERYSSYSQQDQENAWKMYGQNLSKDHFQQKKVENVTVD